MAFGGTPNRLRVPRNNNDINIAIIIIITIIVIMIDTRVRDRNQIGGVQITRTKAVIIIIVASVYI